MWIYNVKERERIVTKLRFGNHIITIYVYIEKGGAIMWLVLGIIAIVATFINFYMYGTGKDYKLAMAMGLSFTALTLVAGYRMVSDWVELEDWSALLDVMPTMETALGILTIISILLNITPILLELKNKK